MGSMGEPLGAEKATAIAAAFLGEYWRDRVERAGTEGELRAGFRDVFLRGLEAQPERSIAAGELREALEERLGAERVTVRQKGKLATVDIAGISASTAKADFAALQDVVAWLGSHATLAEIAIEGKQPAEVASTSPIDFRAGSPAWSAATAGNSRNGAPSPARECRGSMGSRRFSGRRWWCPPSSSCSRGARRSFAIRSSREPAPWRRSRARPTRWPWLRSSGACLLRR